jgi:hypothetical protein
VIVRERLLKAIEDDLVVCRESQRLHEDKTGRNAVECSALATHLAWTQSVGEDQAVLQSIVNSLESNPFLQSYESWRERCEVHAA